jgi:hypothetical protein
MTQLLSQAPANTNIAEVIDNFAEYIHLFLIFNHRTNIAPY